LFYFISELHSKAHGVIQVDQVASLPSVTLADRDHHH